MRINFHLLEKSFFTRVLGRFALAGVMLVGTLVWAWPINNPTEAAPPTRVSKVTICHRTRSTTNPYRRITVSVNAAKGGHTSHSKTGSTVHPPWISGQANGGTWGDIIPRVLGTGSSVKVNEVNYPVSGTGTSGSAEERGYAIYNGTSVGATSYSGKCPSMTAKEFIRVHVESGGSVATAISELDEMAASEDDALRQSIGTTFSSWYTSLGSPTDLTTLESNIDSKSPSVTTADATSVGTPAGSATLNGTVLPRGVALSVWFEYSTSSSMSSATQVDTGLTLGGSAGTSIASGNNGSVAASLVLSGLTSGQTYYYRLVALSTSGTGDSAVDTVINGNIVPFTMGSDNQAIDLTAAADTTYGTPVTISATSKDGTVSGSPTGLTVSFESDDTSICTVGSSTNSGSAAYTSTATITPVSVGTCTIRATQPGGPGVAISGKSYRAAATVIDSIVISAKSLTVTGVSTSNKQYDGNRTATVSCSSPAPTSADLVAGDAGLVSVSCTSPSGLFADANVGTSKTVTPSGITLTGGRANRYSLTFSLTANITTKNLTVTADDKTIAEGATGSFSVAGSGLVGSDQLNNAGGTTYTFAGIGSTSYASSTTQPTVAGTYSITPSAVAFTTGSASNYNIFYVAGTLTIAAVGSLSVQTIDFPSLSGKTFGDSDFNVDATSMSGSTPTGLLVDLISLTPGICTVATSSLTGNVSRSSVSIVAAGTCQIRASQSGGTSGSTTYSSASNETQSFVISPKAVVITADNKSKVVDDPDPTFSVSQTGLVSPNTVSGVTYTFTGTGSTSYAASTTVPTAVGTYSITPSAATLGGGGNTANYTFSYNPGSYTITAASSGGSGGGGGGGSAPVAATTTTTTISAATTSTSTTVLSRRITICHRTMAGTFVEITVDRNSLGGHANHETDIIPAPPGGCGQRAINQFLATTTTTIADSDGGRTTEASPRRITICHWNASDSYVQITVDANGLNGHGDHPNDIIPAPAGGCGRASVQRVLSSTTTTTVAPGSLEDTKQKLDEERKGGKDKSILDVVNLDAEPKPGGGGGGTIEIDPKKDGPGVQLLDAKTNDPNVKVDVKSSGSDYNKTDTWVNEGFGSYCWKIESFNGEYSYILPSPPNPPDSRYAGLAYSAVKVKAGSVVESNPNYQANTVFMNPAPGSMVWPDVNKNGILDPGGQGGGTLGDKAISHIILCVGETEFPEILTTTTTTTIPSGTTTTTTSGTTTTVVGSTTSAPVRSTTTTVRPTATTTRATTTTVRPTATTARATTTTARATTSTTVGATATTQPGSPTTTSGVSATTQPGSPTTTTGSSATTQPGSPTTTTGPSATTQPGSPTTTVPDSTPPIVIELDVPDEGFTKQSVVVELLVSTGAQTETVFLEVDLKRFSVGVPQQVLVLPATGVQATGNSGVFAQALAGLGALLAGAMLLLVGRSRRRSH